MAKKSNAGKGKDQKKGGTGHSSSKSKTTHTAKATHKVAAKSDAKKHPATAKKPAPKTNLLKVASKIAHKAITAVQKGKSAAPASKKAPPHASAKKEVFKSNKHKMEAQIKAKIAAQKEKTEHEKKLKEKEQQLKAQASQKAQGKSAPAKNNASASKPAHASASSKDKEMSAKKPAASAPSKGQTAVAAKSTGKQQAIEQKIGGKNAKPGKGKASAKSYEEEMTEEEMTKAKKKDDEDDDEEDFKRVAAKSKTGKRAYDNDEVIDTSFGKSMRGGKYESDLEAKIADEIAELREHFSWKDIADAISTLEFFITPKNDECIEKGCDNIRMTLSWCRLHYLKNWKSIQRRKEILKEGKLQEYIEELISKYPPKFIEAIMNDLSDDKEFFKVLNELNITSELEFEDDEFEAEADDDGDDDIGTEVRFTGTMRYEEEG